MFASLRVRIALCAVILVAASASVTTAASHTRPRTIPVYLFAGQSNMVGSSTSIGSLASLQPRLLKALPRVLFFGPTDDHATAWSPLKAPTEIGQVLFGTGFGPELSAAAALARPDEPIAIVKFARNGTSLFHDWDPARTDGLYSTLLSRTRTALASLATATHLRPRLAGLFWMQGESDSYDKANAQAYATHLVTFFNKLRTDLHAPHMPAVFGRIASTAGPFSNVVRDAQLGVAQAHAPLDRVVETIDLEHDVVSPMHLSSAGELELGRRFARALAG